MTKKWNGGSSRAWFLYVCSRSAIGTSARHCIAEAARGEGGQSIKVSGSIYEAIAEADDGFDLPARVAELGPQPADVHVDRSGFDEPVVAPHPLQQAIP